MTVNVEEGANRQLAGDGEVERAAVPPVNVMADVDRVWML